VHFYPHCLLYTVIDRRVPPAGAASTLSTSCPQWN